MRNVQLTRQLLSSLVGNVDEHSVSDFVSFIVSLNVRCFWHPVDQDRMSVVEQLKLQKFKMEQFWSMTVRRLWNKKKCWETFLQRSEQIILLFSRWIRLGTEKGKKRSKSILNGAKLENIKTANLLKSNREIWPKLFFCFYDGELRMFWLFHHSKFKQQ